MTVDWSLRPLQFNLLLLPSTDVRLLVGYGVESYNNMTPFIYPI